MPKKSRSILKNQQVIILGLLALVMSIVVFGPVLSKLQERLSIKKSLTDKLFQLETKFTMLNSVDPNLVNDRVRKMEEVFPSKKPIVQLMGALAELSSNRGLSFGGVSLNPGKLNEGAKDKTSETKAGASELDDLSFGFEVGGSFGNILGFLKDLENAAPLMKIDEISLAIKTNPLFETQETLVTANIEVSAFFQPPPTSLGAVSKSIELLSREDEFLLNKLINFKSFKAVIPVAPTGKVDLFL